MFFSKDYEPHHQEKNFKNYDILDNECKQIADFLYEYVFTNFETGDAFKEYKTVDQIAIELLQESRADFYDFEERKYIYFFRNVRNDNFMDLIGRLIPVFRMDLLKGEKLFDYIDMVEKSQYDIEKRKEIYDF